MPADKGMQDRAQRRPALKAEHFIDTTIAIHTRYVGWLMKFSHGWMADTSPRALRVWLDLNHALPASRKLQMVAEMYESAMATYAAQERALHPEAGEREIFLRVAARRLGWDLVERVYGWRPDV